MRCLKDHRAHLSQPAFNGLGRPLPRRTACKAALQAAKRPSALSRVFAEQTRNLRVTPSRAGRAPEARGNSGSTSQTNPEPALAGDRTVAPRSVLMTRQSCRRMSSKPPHNYVSFYTSPQPLDAALSNSTGRKPRESRRKIVEPPAGGDISGFAGLNDYAARFAGSRCQFT